jgi:glycosyltransferase involved in cell wall biosynthesis
MSRASRLQFHLLSFEGPDRYARAGGLASRVTGLAEALAGRGFDTHLWFVGDPDLPGEDRAGRLVLHRWCQWISRCHPAGVYDGEWGKVNDYAASLPSHLVAGPLRRHLRPSSTRAVIVAEEWHTVPAVIRLDELLRQQGLRDRASILWNANNVFGFEHIDWGRLAQAATITTVSRYMRYLMWAWGIDPAVLPNGLGPDAFQPPDPGAVATLRARTHNRLLLAKVARWDPDKRWIPSMNAIAALRTAGAQPLLVARGGMESYGAEVLRHATGLGLKVSERPVVRGGGDAFPEAVSDSDDCDVIVLSTALDAPARSILFAGSDAVLANSGHEPFGLVGLETMAAGGIACTGGTGEDYAVPHWNSLVMPTADPWELAHQLQGLRADPRKQRALRARGRATARRYAWRSVVDRHLLGQANRPWRPLPGNDGPAKTPS